MKGKNYTLVQIKSSKNLKKIDWELDFVNIKDLSLSFNRYILSSELEK